MDKEALRYSLLTDEDKAIYMRLVNAPRWKERADEYKEREDRLVHSSPGSFNFFDYLRIFPIIRGRFFHADQRRAERIQNFLKDMQVKYDCDSIDHTAFPGYERWQ